RLLLLEDKSGFPRKAAMNQKKALTESLLLGLSYLTLVPNNHSLIKSSIARCHFCSSPQEQHNESHRSIHKSTKELGITALS
ncbi:hypothetical protein AB6D66_14270, partial [Vibrio pomeroyi]